jgi:hypothetical protein
VHSKLLIQAFLDFRGFDFLDFQFNTVYNSILFSSPLVLLSDLDLRGFHFRIFFSMFPHINILNRGMLVLLFNQTSNKLLNILTIFLLST